MDNVIKCPKCPDNKPKLIFKNNLEFKPVVDGIRYTINFEGLFCTTCGYQTVETKSLVRYFKKIKKTSKKCLT